MAVVRFDISLLERLYSQPDIPGGMVKTMLDVQYRSPKKLNAFPSKEFYKGRLKTSDANFAESLNVLKASSFPWPIRDGVIIPAVVYSVRFRKGFVRPVEEQRPSRRCTSCIHVLKFLSTPKNPTEEEDNLKVTVLLPYTKQVQALRHSRRLPVTSMMRCNVDGDVGFLDDPRRLNVMWTRARLALIIVGDRATLSSNQLWKRTLAACMETAIKLEGPTTV